MKLHIKFPRAALGVVAGLLIAGGGYALAASRRSSVIHACVNQHTRTLSVPRHGRCGAASSRLAWNRRGPRGRRGARGAVGPTGAVGATGAAGVPGPSGRVGVPGPAGAGGPEGPGLDAWGQVWVGGDLNTARLAPGTNSHNVIGVGGGDGTASVQVSGCSGSGLAEPVIEVTADHDRRDDVAGANNTPHTAVAWVSGWDVPPDTAVLDFDVGTMDPAGGASVNSDFSFTVTC